MLQNRYQRRSRNSDSVQQHISNDQYFVFRNDSSHIIRRQTKNEDDFKMTIAERLRRRNKELVLSSTRNYEDRMNSSVNDYDSAKIYSYKSNKVIQDYDNYKNTYRRSTAAKTENNTYSSYTYTNSSYGSNNKHSNNTSTRTTTTPSYDNGNGYSSYKKDSNSYGSNNYSSTLDTNTYTTNSLYKSRDTPRDVARKLQFAQNDKKGYKQKYEEVIEETQNLAKEMLMVKEDMEKLEALKYDNLRLKHENGALFRVIGKLSLITAS